MYRSLQSTSEASPYTDTAPPHFDTYGEETVTVNIHRPTSTFMFRSTPIFKMAETAAKRLKATVTIGEYDLRRNIPRSAAVLELDLPTKDVLLLFRHTIICP